MNKLNFVSVDLALERFYCLPKRDYVYRVIVGPEEHRYFCQRFILQLNTSAKS